ncbi:DNA-directed RNA polymerase subunit omega [Oscillospiraceae bacterium 50-16]|jgi:DNA-directed RNA polymerase subunit omega|nr:DNA-directed RNA polymerase subunit omega [Lawsonibacter sp.]
MMLYPAMKDLLDKVPSRYELVNVVACRARSIAREAEIEGQPLQEKPVSIAIQEVAEGRLERTQTEQAE